MVIRVSYFLLSIFANSFVVTSMSMSRMLRKWASVAAMIFLSARACFSASVESVVQMICRPRRPTYKEDSKAHA